MIDHSPSRYSRSPLLYSALHSISARTITMKQACAISLLLLSGASAFAPLANSNTNGRVAAPADVMQLASAADDKTEVREYFNTEGFNRWNKIYSESDEINSVQMDIRTGHDQTIQKILNWIVDDNDIAGKSVCDCGCGVGSLAIPLAQMGAKISASDISDSMANEAARRAEELGIDAEFYTSDLESVSGKYNTVTCVDVAIHYPSEKMAEMIGHLCDLAEDRVIISFAPKTWFYVFLKKVGEMFPGPSKTTRAYLHDEEFVVDTLKKAGFEVQRNDMTATNFYFSRLLEAKKTQ
uniref:Magnesium-protoporphyrin IX methyltransferase C-terminal domain-containing protein n=1 Tax=Craspedostauros australis TaxID=1486917 RepID=A0A7R9WQY0_9STRA